MLKIIGAAASFCYVPAETGKTYRNDYGYDDQGRLISVTHNTTGAASDVRYDFAYDALGARTEVKVAGHTLSKNIYNEEDRGHRLEKGTVKYFSQR